MTPTRKPVLRRQTYPEGIKTVASTFASNEVSAGSPYGVHSECLVHSATQSGQPLGLVTATSGVVGTTSPRWNNQADAQALLTSADSLTPDFIDEGNEKALGLLQTGMSIAQVAVTLGIPTVLIRRWWLQQTVSGDPAKVDGRRLYNDAFKAEALRQIHQGVSVRQLAKSMGVTQVTLHKWRKQVPFLPEPLTDDWLSSEPSAPSEIRIEESSTERIARLEQQLRQVEAERDTLKKAIQILMRAS